MARRVIATAAVEVGADTTGVERQLNNLIDPIKHIGRVFERETDLWVQEMREAADDMDRLLERALNGEDIREMGYHFDNLAGTAERTGERIEGSFREAARQAKDWLGDHLGDAAGLFSDLTFSAERAGERIESSFREAARQSERHLRGISLGQLGLAGLGAVLANAAGEITRFGLTTTDQLETARARFGGLTDSAAEADEMMRRMVDYAVATPFDLPGVSNAAAQLVAVGDGFGVTTDNVTEYLDVIGNASAATGGTGVEMARLVRVFGQMSSSGKVLGQDMNQLAQNLPGLDVWQALADGTGKSVAELRQLQDLGTLDELLTGNEAVKILLEAMEGIPGAGRDWEALADATGKTVAQLQDMPSGEVAALAEEYEVGMTAMERRMTTLGGVWEKFKDTAGLALADGLKPFVKELKTSMTDPAILSGITSMSEAFGGLLSSIVSGIAPVMPELMGIFTELMHVIGEMAPIMEPVLALFAVLGRALMPIIRAFTQFIGRAAKPLMNLVEDLTPVIEELGTTFSTILATALSALMPLFEALLDVVAAVAPILPPLAAAFLSIVAALTPLVDVVAQVVAGLAEALVPIVEALAPVLEELGLIIAEQLGVAIEALSPLLLALVPLFASLGELLIALMPLLPPLVELFILFATRGLTLILAALPAVVVLIDLLSAALSWLAEKLTPIIEAVANFVTKVVGFFQDLYDILVGHSIIPDLVNAIIGWFQTLWAVVEPIVSTMVTVITALFDGAKWAIENIIGPLVSWIVGRFQWLWNTVQPIIGFIASTVRTMFDGFRWAWDNIVSPVAGWVKDKVQWLWDNAGPVIDSISGALSSVFDTFRDAYNNVVVPITNAVVGAFQWVWDKIGPIVDGILGLWNSITAPVRWLFGGGGQASSFNSANGGRGGAPGFSNGGFGDFGAGALAVLHGREAVIPMENPRRAMEVMQQTGLDRFAARMGGGDAGGVHFHGGQTFQDATDADLVAQRTLVALQAAMAA